jgi:hypothetical protein
MEVKAKAFETNFSVQATAMINYVLTSFEDTEGALNAQQKMIDSQQVQINAQKQQAKDSEILFNNLVKKARDQEAEIIRLHKELAPKPATQT